MALKPKVIALWQRHGAAIHIAANVVLEACLPGSPAVLKLVSSVFDCVIQKTHDQPDFDESKLPLAGAEDWQRVDQMLDILAGELQVVLAWNGINSVLPEAAKQAVNVILAMDEHCPAALHKLNYLAQRFECLEEQNRRVLQGQGYTTRSLEEILPLLGRTAGAADYFQELRTAQLTPAEFCPTLRSFQQGVHALADGRVAEAGRLLEQVARKRPQSAAVAVAVAAARAAGRDLLEAEKSLKRAIRLCPQDAQLAKLQECVVRAIQSEPFTQQGCGTARPPLHQGAIYWSKDGGRAVAPVDTPVLHKVWPVSRSKNDVTGRIKGRYQLGNRLAERCGLARYRGVDLGAAGSSSPVPVIILYAPVVRDGQQAAWPTISWERALLDRIDHPAFPAKLDSFTEGGYEYLIEEMPAGQSLWNAWNGPETTTAMRFGWLKQIALAMHKLHHSGAMLEAIRPSLVTIDANRQVRLNDLSDLLPLPLPPDVPVRGTLYTAPELAARSTSADARASLYSFGAMVLALHQGRELHEKNDFASLGNPMPLRTRYPDMHPLLFRLVTKTFVRDLGKRVPKDKENIIDPTGFAELVRTLEVCRRTLDFPRLEVGAWTTTGTMRAGNEDAFALLHSAESRLDEVCDSTLVFVADGKGGDEAGRLAATLAMQTLRQNLCRQKPFSSTAGQSSFPADAKARPADSGQPLDIESTKKQIVAALRDANKQVCAHSRNSRNLQRIMSCTVEVVYIDGRNVIIGHVGNGRTYHFREGRLIQLTGDQTEKMGTGTSKTRSQSPFSPAVYHAILKQGDWIVVCSHGLVSHVTNDVLRQTLQSKAISADTAARRLTNLAISKGASDNSTVVVIRAT